MLNSIFLNGLKEEIQAELKLHESHDLTDIMDRALLIEERNDVMTRKGGGWKDRGGTFRFKDPGEYSEPKKEEKNVSVITEKPKGRRLSPAELEEMSKKGLCFKCREKWSKEHVCKFKHMHIKLCEGSSYDVDEGEWAVTEEQVEVDEETQELKTL
jgi:hypothetical protein